MKQVTCCGAIIYFKNKFLVIKHSEGGGSHWYFPKGHMEANETMEQTAKREIFEETNLQTKFIDRFKEMINYVDVINNSDKTAVFFLANAFSNDVIIDNNEVIDYKWLEFNQAYELLTHNKSKELLIKANNFLKMIK